MGIVQSIALQVYVWRLLAETTHRYPGAYSKSKFTGVGPWYGA